MSVNLPETQVLVDRDDKVVVKVGGWFNTATTTNTTILQANTLYGANASAPCPLTITAVQLVTSLANGFVQLYYVGPSSNVGTLYLGRSLSSTIEAYCVNPFSANGTLTATVPGDIGLWVNGAASGDSYSLIIQLAKEKGTVGWANTFSPYN